VVVVHDSDRDRMTVERDGNRRTSASELQADLGRARRWSAASRLLQRAASGRTASEGSTNDQPRYFSSDAAQGGTPLLFLLDSRDARATRMALLRSRGLEP